MNVEGQTDYKNRDFSTRKNKDENIGRKLRGGGDGITGERNRVVAAHSGGKQEVYLS